MPDGLLPSRRHFRVQPGKGGGEGRLERPQVGVKAVELIAAFHVRKIDCPRLLPLEAHRPQWDDGRRRWLALARSRLIWVQTGSGDAGGRKAQQRRGRGSGRSVRRRFIEGQFPEKSAPVVRI